LGFAEFATTLYSDHHEWAVARAFSQAAHFAAYLDVSTNGGATWNGWQDTVYNTYQSTITDWTNPEGSLAALPGTEPSADSSRKWGK
jgi:hypothetical protein